jgi:hypothetical protein
VVNWKLLEEAVDRLPKNADALRKFLAGENAVGEPGNQESCVLANWVAEQAMKLYGKGESLHCDVTVTHSWMRISYDDWNEDVHDGISFPLAYGQMDFIISFDARMYPELER